MPKINPIPSTNFPVGVLTRLALPDAEIYYQPDLFTRAESVQYFQQLDDLPTWAARSITVYGRPCQQNRETLYYGSQGTNYRYSGINNPGDGKIPKVIQDLTQRVEARLTAAGLLSPGQHFNYWLGNRYLTGDHNIGMHSDDEDDLVGPIVSLSFGSDRYFDLAPRERPQTGGTGKTRLNLNNGSVLVMAGATQLNYLHGVPTQKKITRPRINLTLRMVRSSVS